MIKCTFEDGGSISLRHVVVDGIIIRGNKVLLNKRGTHNGKPLLESGKWSLIGGFVDRDETIAEAFKREAIEEAGCKVKNVKFFRIKDNPNRPNEKGRQNIAFVMVADFVSIIDVQTEEVLELKWFDLDNLPPLEKTAFDHGEDLYKYKEYLKDKNSLKILERFPANIL